MEQTTPRQDGATDGVIQIAPLPDPATRIAELRREIREWDGYWEAQHQAALTREGAASPAAVEAATARQLLRGLLAPRLDQMAADNSPHLGMFLNLMVPFDTQGGLNEFFLHFFQAGEGAQGKPEYQLRDPYERDLYVLYDLYRVKKTQEVISILQQARKTPERVFPSIFSEEEITAILHSLNRVLVLLPGQCLPENRRKEIFPHLSPEFLRGRHLLERRQEGLLYTFPHVLEKYDYRRFFFLVFFKTGLRAKVGQEEREFRYDFIHFQVLKHEFMLHWLTGPLLTDPRKYEVYKKYQMHGKTFLELIVEKPENERNLLQQMSAHALNDMASQVNDAVPDELKIGVIPESLNFGFYHQLKKRLSGAVEMVRAPMANLRKKVEEHDEPDLLAEPPLPGEATPEAEPPPPPASRWEVTLLKKNQLNQQFFTDTIANFQTQLGALRTSMGTYWKPFAAYVSDLLERTPEIQTIRRRTPKHEWVMPYRMRWIEGETSKEYLLILGAEAKAKTRGMGYNAREAYSFSPYFVFATDSDEGEGFGQADGERMVMGHKLPTYSHTNPAVAAKVIDLVEVLKTRR